LEGLRASAESQSLERIVRAESTRVVNDAERGRFE